MKRKRDAVTVALPLTSSAFATGSEVADKKALTLEGARKADAHKNNSGGVIAVVDDGGNLMALERLDGTFAAGANISVGKARTAALFKEATKFLEDVIGKSRTSMVALNDFMPLQIQELRITAQWSYCPSLSKPKLRPRDVRMGYNMNLVAGHCLLLMATADRPGVEDLRCDPSSTLISF